MKFHELIEKINNSDTELCRLYPDIEAARTRLTSLLHGFADRYGRGGDLVLLSVPGRTELVGNHVDHNGGAVLAGSITRDIIAVARRESDGVIRMQSEGRPEDVITVGMTASTDSFERESSASLIAGVVNGFVKAGYEVGGFSAYTTTEVLSGSGLSSSAAFECMVGTVINHLYCDGAVSALDISKIAQYSENEYFGKPCGLMDQIACAYGGFVFIDFKEKCEPYVMLMELSLGEAGLGLCIVATGGSHSDLTDDYASVPREMKSVANYLSHELLKDVTESEIVENIKPLRESVGDRAVLRALHFVRECERSRRAKEAVLGGDIDALLECLNKSGRSSFEYLQNVYTVKNTDEQGISLALALTDGYLSGTRSSYRVHGGGFAGTIQAIMPKELIAGYTELMESVFGEGCVMALDIRAVGATRIF